MDPEQTAPIEANSVDPEQTAPLASILNSSVMLGNY